MMWLKDHAAEHIVARHGKDHLAFHCSVQVGGSCSSVTPARALLASSRHLTKTRASRRTFAAAGRPVGLRFLGLAAQECGHVQVVCRNIRAYLADILLD